MLNKAKKTIIDGFVFDSKFESQIYMILKNAESKKIINKLELQKIYKLKINDDNIGRYKIDFVFEHKNYKLPIAVEVKGYMRDRDAIRFKTFRALYKDQLNVLIVWQNPKTTKKELENEVFYNLFDL